MKTFSTVAGAYEARVAEHVGSKSPFATGAACVDGNYCPVGEARVPLLDLGFLRSDLTYDVAAVWDGRFFRLDDHLDRLEASCRKIQLTSPLARPALRAMLIELVRKADLRDAYVDIIVTRGQRFPGASDPRQSKPAIYAFAVPFVWIVPLAEQARGTSVVVTRGVRRTPPGAMDPTVKNLQWGDMTRGIFEARDRGAMFPLLPDGDGNITEGSGYNIVTIRNDVLRSPGQGVLEGVTRKTVVEIAQAQGRKVVLEPVSVASLYECDEIFLCSTAGGIMPVTTLDGAPVGNGTVGPVTSEVWDAYWALQSDPQLSFAITYA